MSLQQIYTAHGAVLAGDGIPLHFGDLKAEYLAALNHAVVLDRSHQARVEVTGDDRFEIINRISTNNVLNMRPGEGRATLFTNPTGRILDRAIALNWRADSLLLAGGPGRAPALSNYLNKQIFFNDKARASDSTSGTHQFDLLGPLAAQIVGSLIPETRQLAPMDGLQADINGASVFAIQVRPAFAGTFWTLIMPQENAALVWQLLMEAGAPHGLKPSGGLIYNVLRIRAGVPGAGRELTADYIPLELGLWDEVSFNKGCYTGQEIIARMDSREQLARTIVRLSLSDPVEAPADLYHEGKRAGVMTSSAQAPDGECFAIGVIKTALIQPGTQLTLGDNGAVTVAVMELLGTQPAWITQQIQQN